MAFMTSPTAVKFVRAAELLDVSPSTISRMVEVGDLPTIVVGKSRRIPRAAITAMVDGQPPTVGETLDEFVARTTEASGVALVVDDPAVLERLGRLLVRAVTDASGRGVAS
jgi:excisionase family DNA binding protein